MTGALAIILARGGSKGLPRKNVLPIAGKPCIEWTLEHALGSRSVATTVLSTDDEEIAAVARRRSVAVVARSAELAGDRATVDAAAREALRLAPGGAVASRPIVILYGNVPVRPADLVDRAVAMLVESGADSVQSYAPVGKFHPWWMTRIDEATGAVRPWEGDVLNHGVFRRQDLPPAFVPDGGVIAVRREALMLEIAGVRPGPHAFFGREDRRRGVVNAEGEVVDIDSVIDLRVAEAVLSGQEGIMAERHRGIP